MRVAGGFLFPLLAMSGLLAMEVFSGLRAFVSLLRLHYRNARQRRLSRRIAVQWRPSVSLTIYNAATPDYGVEKRGRTWLVPGILLAAAYFFYTYRSFSGEIRP